MTVEPKVLPSSTPSIHVDPFPQLSNHGPNNLLDAATRNLWANFGKPRIDSGAEIVSINSGSGERNRVLESKRAKARGKARWQPLEL